MVHGGGGGAVRRGGGQGAGETHTWEAKRPKTYNGHNYSQTYRHAHIDAEIQSLTDTNKVTESDVVVGPSLLAVLGWRA